LVGGGKKNGLGNIGEVALRGALALDLRDHMDAFAGR
jgi:hypothetical protein